MFREVIETISPNRRVDLNIVITVGLPREHVESARRALREYTTTYIYLVYLVYLVYFTLVYLVYFV